jgi:hypothetical protein
MSTIIRELVYEGHHPVPQILTALGSLAEKGLTVPDGSAYRLSEESAYLARRMLIIDTSLVLTAGHLGPDGIVSVGGFTCLQAGVHDLLYLDATAGTVEIQAVSSAIILDYIRALMTDPSLLKKLDGPAKSPQKNQPSGKKFCPQCGTSISEGKKFCNNCGAKIS